MQRPDYNTSAQIQRRAATVRAFLNEHGFTLDDGTVAARCPECGQVRAKFIADHIVPIADGGMEDGALAVHCRTCSSRQGAQIANKRQHLR